MGKRHPYGNWRYLLQNGKEKKKLQFPSRERVLVRQALVRAGYRYKETIAFLNPLYKGWKGAVDAGMQWLDFTVWTGDRMVVLMFYPRAGGGGLHAYQKRAWQAKQDFLNKKGVPFIVLSRSDTSQIYEHLIKTFVRKEKRT